MAAVAVGWGGNVNEFLEAAFGVALPDAISKSPSDGGVVNIPAVFIVLVISFLLTIGHPGECAGQRHHGGRETRHSGVLHRGGVHRLQQLALHAVRSERSQWGDRRRGGDLLAYIGFDAVSTGSEESKNPGRDLPIAIIGSLLISTVIYVLVSIAAVGVAPVETLTGSDAPLAAALREGAGLPWAGGILAAGALVAITTVVLVIIYGQTRIFFAMCRDGMFPRRLAHVHPRYGTPARLTSASAS